MARKVVNFGVKVSVGRDVVRFTAVQKRKGGFVEVAPPIEFMKDNRNKQALRQYLDRARNPVPQDEES